jgi:plastocyanin
MIKGDLRENLTSLLLCSISVAIIYMLLMSSSSIITALPTAFATTAESMFQSKSLTLPPNIKHLVILIPNEAHESQRTGDSSSDQRLINQIYVPQKAIVSPGTIVTWFNGDADHDHKITLTNEVNPEIILSESAEFAFNEASNPIVLNDTGTFNYYETDVNEEDTDFVMNGTIEVVDQQDLNANIPAPSGSNSTSTLGNGDTAGVLMVPTEDIDTYIQDLEGEGFAIDSTHNFNDIRAGDQQALLVWTTSGMNLDEIISTLQEITPGLPYS